MKSPLTLAFGCALAIAAGCGATDDAQHSSSEPSEEAGASAPGASSPSAPADAGSAVDPFAAQPDESEGLTNVSADLGALLEGGALTGACDRYRATPTNRKDMLLCGKWMYFYETFGTGGVPAAIVRFLAKNFPAELGLGFSKLGMVVDPSSADSLPLGLAPTAKLNGSIDALAFTCASCHFGKLSDGRFSVGAPNHDYDYGRHILTIVLAPTLGVAAGNVADHDPAAVAKVKPVLDRLAGDFGLRARFGLALLPLISGSPSQPGLNKEIEGAYASWPLGTLDFMIAPLPVDDNVHIQSKMIGLWGLPRPAEIATSGMSSALLAWTGAARGVEEFVQGFADLGGTKTPLSKEQTRPLTEYVYSLRAPANPSPPEAAQVASGAALFTIKGCAACHDGPRGSGKRAYTFEEIGTDRALARWADPDLSGTGCCGLDIKPGVLTHGVKSPRLVGMWAQRRFLHNGSLASLEQLFCLEPRPAGTEPGGTAGHGFTCDGLSVTEKRALIAYTRAH